MSWWVAALVSVAIALAVCWLALVLALLRSRPGPGAAREAMRVLPDTLRLVTALARDRSLPRGVRVRLWLLLGYLASPIDVIPDFIPVIGYADDVIVVGWALRSVVRRVGLAGVSRHWRGTPTGFAALARVTGLRIPEPDHEDGASNNP